MLIRFFTRSFATQYIATAVTALALWSLCLYDPPLMPAPDGQALLYSGLYDLLSPYPLIGVVAGFLLVLGEAFYLNAIFSANELIPKNSSLAGFLFILMMSSSRALMTLTPVSISVFFLLYILRNLLLAYNRSEPVDLAFTSGFMVSLATLVYFPMIFFYGFLLTSFVVYRSMHWREWISSFIGLITPVLFLATAYFWTDQIGYRIAEYNNFLRNFTLPEQWITPGSLVPAGSTLLLGITGLAYASVHISEKNVEIRKKMVLLFWLLFWTLVAMPFSHRLLGFHLSLATVSFAALTGNFFLGTKKKNRWSILLWLYILIILIISVLSIVQ